MELHLSREILKGYKCQTLLFLLCRAAALML